MKVDLHVVMVLSVKFGDHRRWSESAARGVHAQPLWAARGSASGFHLRCVLVRSLKLSFRTCWYIIGRELLRFVN